MAASCSVDGSHSLGTETKLSAGGSVLFFPFGRMSERRAPEGGRNGQKDDYDGKMKTPAPPSSLSLGGGENEDHLEGSLNLLQGGIE